MAEPFKSPCRDLFQLDQDDPDKSIPESPQGDLPRQPTGSAVGQKSVSAEGAPSVSSSLDLPGDCYVALPILEILKSKINYNSLYLIRRYSHCRNLTILKKLMREIKIIDSAFRLNK